MSCKGCKNPLPKKAENLRYCVYCGKRCPHVPTSVKWTTGLMAFGIAIGVLLYLLLRHSQPDLQTDLVNIAPQYGIASADVTISGYPAGNAIDGVNASCWNAGSCGSSSSPRWWKVDLQQNRQVSEIVVNTGIPGTGSPNLGYTNVYNLYVSSDGSSWSSIGSGTLTTSTDPEAYSDRHILSDQMPAIRYVKYEVVGGTNWAHLSEMEVLVEPDATQPPMPSVTSVNPDHGTQGQTLTVTINGTNFTGATAVSFGPDITVNSFTLYSASQITANISIGAAAFTGGRTVVVNGAYLQSGFMVTPS